MTTQRPGFLWQWDESAGPVTFRAEAWRRDRGILIRIQRLDTWETVESFLASHASYERTFGEEWMGKLQAYLKKLSSQTAKAGKPAGPADPEFEKQYPLVYALLTDDDAGDGKKRTLSKVSLWREPGGFKASITEPDRSVSCFVTSLTLQGLLGALEARLTSDEPDVWRPWSGNYGGGKKRR